MNRITLHQVRPEPIFSKPSPPKHSEVWDKECHFEQGQRYWVKAASGEGKSTLLHIIFGLRKDYGGVVEVLGRNPKELSAQNLSVLRKKELSMVFQDLRLLPAATAWANVELSRQLCEAKTQAEVRKMGKTLGLDAFWEQECGTLSYGQRQRVAILRALCRPFRFLLLDEPFSHLDAGNAEAASQLIQQELEKNGAGLVLVSHELHYGLGQGAILEL